MVACYVGFKNVKKHDIFECNFATWKEVKTSQFKLKKKIMFNMVSCLEQVKNQQYTFSV